MQGGEFVIDYFSRTLAIANKMRIYGERLEDVTIIKKILRSMTASLIILFVPLKTPNILIVFLLTSYRVLCWLMNRK